MDVVLTSSSTDQTVAIGRTLGACLKGGEVIELRSDLGGGKTTLTRGIAEGTGSKDPVASPSFTICNTYSCTSDVQISHFDFYRLSEPGIVAEELREVLQDPSNITIIEWPGIVEGVLPDEHISAEIRTHDSDERTITFKIPDTLSHISAALKKGAI